MYLLEEKMKSPFLKFSSIISSATTLSPAYTKPINCMQFSSHKYSYLSWSFSPYMHVCIVQNKNVKMMIIIGKILNVDSNCKLISKFANRCNMNVANVTNAVVNILFTPYLRVVVVNTYTYILTFLTNYVNSDLNNANWERGII